MAVTISDEIDELQRKIALLGKTLQWKVRKPEKTPPHLFFLDGDKKAYSETSQWAMKQNKDLILHLRSENKALRSKLSKRMKADDEIIAEIFQAKNVRMPAELRGINGDVAAQRFDQSICELIKRQNALQHVKRSHEQTLAGLEAEVFQLEAEAVVLSATPSGDSKEAKTLRQLENSLDKAVIKNSEAKHIKKSYDAIIQKLEDVCDGYFAP